MADFPDIVNVFGTVPQLTLTDTDPGAKSLRIDVNNNVAQIREKGGGDNSLMRFDLANNRIGVFAPPTAPFSFNVAKTLTTGDPDSVASFGVSGDTVFRQNTIAVYGAAEGRSGDITNLRSLEFIAYGNGVGDIANESVLVAGIGNFGTGVVTNAHTIRIQNPEELGTGPITNTIAIRIARDTGVRTRKYGFYYGSGGEPPGSFAIYADVDNSYFGGSVRISGDITLVPPTAQRNAIASPATGLLVYNTTTNKFNFFNGTAWEQITSSVV